MPAIFAQAAAASDVGHLLIVAIVLAGVVGVALVVARQSGLAVPAWVFTIAWIVLAVVCGVFAIRFLLGVL